MKHSIVSELAQIHPSVKVGDFVKIHDNVSIDEGTVVEDYSVIGYPTGKKNESRLVISKNSLIRTHTVIYEGSSFGEHLNVGHHSMIRSGVKAGRSLQIGSFNDIEGDCEIGDWVRFHSNVHIGRGAVIKDLVWIFPYAVLTNDPIPPSGLKEGVTLEEATVVCTSSVVLPGAHLGKGAFVAALSRAKGKVPPGSLVVGFDGTIVGGVDKIKHAPSGKKHPWMNHFSNYYPADAQEKIRSLHQEIVEELASREKNGIK